MSQRWLTGNTLNSASEYWRVLIPPDDWVRQALLGAIAQLAESENWEKFGTISETAIASAFLEIFDSFEPQPVISGGSSMIKISDHVPTGSNNYIDIACPTSGYSEFLLKVRGGANSGGARLALRFNTDVTNGNYVGLNQAQTAITNRNFLIGMDVSNQQSIGELRVFAPHSTTLKKNFWAKSSISNEYLDTVGYWNSTAQITDIRLTSSQPTVISGFRVELWGLAI
jgi:hypothetical protein